MIAIICATRDRDNFHKELAESFIKTQPKHSRLYFVLDDDQNYWKVSHSAIEYITVPTQKERGSVFAINRACMEIIKNPEVTTIGLLGDDSRFVTQDWEEWVVSCRNSAQVVYVNDGFNGAKLATTPFVSAEIPRALGFLIPPTFKHLFGDNFLHECGNATKSIIYIHDVLIEHLHPLAGKRKPDELTAQLNTQEAFKTGRDALMKYMNESFVKDINKVINRINVNCS